MGYYKLGKNTHDIFFPTLNTLRKHLYLFGDNLTPYCLKLLSRQILRSSQRYALIVYRLIDAALIGHFFLIPFFLKRNFDYRVTIVAVRQ